MQLRILNRIKKLHKQGREDIKVKVNIQSLIHPYIFYTTVVLWCEKDEGMELCIFSLPCLCYFLACHPYISLHFY